MKFRFLTASVALGALTLSSTVEADHCELFAAQPEWLNASIQAEGSWNHCDRNAKVTVLLRKDNRWWFDSTLRESTGSGPFGLISLVRACGTGFEPWKVFVETRYGNKKVQSTRAVLPCG